MESELSAALRKIVVLTQKTDHIPPITTNEANPFPYQVRLVTYVWVMEDYYSNIIVTGWVGGGRMGSCLEKDSVRRRNRAELGTAGEALAAIVYHAAFCSYFHLSFIRTVVDYRGRDHILRFGAGGIPGFGSWRGAAWLTVCMPIV